jgi:hypothetical protein
MLKRIVKSTRITAIVLMALSLITPVQVAQASGTITKEITVLGTDGNPYVGALVTLKFQPPAGGTIPTVALTPVLTNSSGIATLTFSDALTGGELNVQPPATDTTTAVFTDFMNDYANNSPVTVNLRRSQVRINTLTFDNQPAPAFGGVSNGFKEWVFLVRSGVANIGFPDSAANNTCTRFTIFAGDDAVGSFRKFYATKLSGSGETRTATVYTDPGTCLVEAPKVDGVYQLKFNGYNVSGSLLSNSGQALTFAANQGYELQMSALNSNGSINYNVPESYSFANSSGAWSTYVDTSTAGKYQIAFHGYGNSDYPTFATKYFWVTSDKKLS